MRTREVLKSGRGYDTHNDTRDPTRSGTGSNLNNYNTRTLIGMCTMINYDFIISSD